MDNNYTQDFNLDRNVLGGMVEMFEFRLETVKFPVTARDALVTIDLHLTNDLKKHDLRNGIPISGFPRTLADPRKELLIAMCLHAN